jgi:hypothetical protein
MPEPAWLQEIRDRVNAATKGPWMLTSSILGDSLVVLANDEETGVLFPSQVVAHIPGGSLLLLWMTFPGCWAWWRGWRRRWMSHRSILTLSLGCMGGCPASAACVVISRIPSA